MSGTGVEEQQLSPDLLEDVFVELVEERLLPTAKLGLELLNVRTLIVSRALLKERG